MRVRMMLTDSHTDDDENVGQPTAHTAHRAHTHSTHEHFGSRVTGRYNEIA